MVMCMVFPTTSDTEICCDSAASLQDCQRGLLRMSGTDRGLAIKVIDQPEGVLRVGVQTSRVEIMLRFRANDRWAYSSG